MLDPIVWSSWMLGLLIHPIVGGALKNVLREDFRFCSDFRSKFSLSQQGSLTEERWDGRFPALQVNQNCCGIGSRKARKTGSTPGSCVRVSGFRNSTLALPGLRTAEKKMDYRQPPGKLPNARQIEALTEVIVEQSTRDSQEPHRITKRKLGTEGATAAMSKGLSIA